MDTPPVIPSPPVLFTPQVRQQIADAANNQTALAAMPAPQIASPGMVPYSGLPAIPTPRVDVQRSQVLTDQDVLNKTRNAPTGGAQLHNPFLRGLARTADVVGSVFAPGLATAIPGTTLHHEFQVARAQQNLNNDLETQQKQAVTADTEGQTVERQALGEKASAMADADTPFLMSREQAAAINQPSLAGTQTTMRDYNRVLFGAGKDNTSVANNQNTNTTRQSISDDKIASAQQIAAQKPLQRDDHYIQVMEKPEEQRTPEDLAFKQAYENYINTSKTQPGVQRAVAGASARPLQVVLPNGQAGYETAGTAIKTGAQGLGDNQYKAAGAALKDFTSGTDAHTLTAFNTAQGHLQQLSAAASALKNGDIQALNRIANTYGTATGQSAPVVFQGVKTAVSGEIAKAFTGSGATVDEINEVRKSINDAESPEQLRDVANSYSHLLDTKKGVLQQQLESAKKGQANFGGTSPKVGDTKTFPNGKKGVWDGQGYVAQ